MHFAFVCLSVIFSVLLKGRSASTGFWCWLMQCRIKWTSGRGAGLTVTGLTNRWSHYMATVDSGQSLATATTITVQDWSIRWLVRREHGVYANDAKITSIHRALIPPQRISRRIYANITGRLWPGWGSGPLARPDATSLHFMLSNSSW